MIVRLTLLPHLLARSLPARVVVVDVGRQLRPQANLQELALQVGECLRAASSRETNPQG